MGLKYNASGRTYDLGGPQYTNVGGGSKRLNYIASGKTHQLGLATDKTCSQYSPLVMKVNGTNYYIGRSQSSISYKTINTTVNTINILTYGDWIFINAWTDIYFGAIRRTSTGCRAYKSNFSSLSTLHTNSGMKVVYSTYSTDAGNNNWIETHGFLTIYSSYGYAGFEPQYKDWTNSLITACRGICETTESKNITTTSKISSSTSSHNFV